MSAGRYPFEQRRNGAGGVVAGRMKERNRATANYIDTVEHGPRQEEKTGATRCRRGVEKNYSEMLVAKRLKAKERTTSQPSAGSIERALNEQPVVVLATARKGTDDGW